MKNRRILSLVFSLVLCLAALAALLVLMEDSVRAQATTRYVAITGIDSDILDARLQCSSRVAGCDKHGVRLWRLGRLPRQGMFAATAADNENVHTVNAGNAASR